MLEKKKRKIVNDPVHGFIGIPFSLSFDIIEHPFFQRLRHIRQLGLTFLVYPGANHTRFQHALGAMHLMSLALDILRAKGHHISEEETQAAIAAILLHDIGHGPFSHSLEYKIIPEMGHEEVGEYLINHLRKEFGERLDMAISILEGSYPKKFLHQLISSQLDVDRMDYLRRDSFFTGVTEGAIGSDRIIKMLNVVDDNLVVEAKGIYSVEKFLIARRLMYWQVYLHKTVVAAEQLLVQLFMRARYLTQQGEELWTTPSLAYFLHHNVTKKDMEMPYDEHGALYHFANIDDSDLLVSAKQWQFHQDKVLAKLAHMLVHRRPYKVELRNTPFTHEEVKEREEDFVKNHPNLKEYVEFFVVSSSVSNHAYRLTEESIKILYNNSLVDMSLASDMLNTKVLSKEIRKYFLCYVH